MQEPDGTLNTDISLPYAFYIFPYIPLFKRYARTDNWISNCFLSGQSDAKIVPAPYSNKVRLISEISPSHDLLRHLGATSLSTNSELNTGMWDMVLWFVKTFLSDTFSLPFKIGLIGESV